MVNEYQRSLWIQNSNGQKEIGQFNVTAPLSSPLIPCDGDGWGDDDDNGDGVGDAAMSLL